MALLLIIPILSLSFAFPNYSLRKLSYCSSYLLSRHLHGDKNPSLCSLRAGVGFGFGSAPKISKMNDQNSTIGDTTSVVAALKQQVLTIKDSDSCICCSGLSYQACCKPLHQELSTDLRSLPKTLLSTVEPINIVRARYGAYALGLGDFIIQTSHRSQRVKKSFLTHYY